VSRPDPAPRPAGSEPLAFAAVLAVAGLPALAVWLAAAALLRLDGRVRRWHLALGALALGGAWTALYGPQGAVRGHFWLLDAWGHAALSGGDPAGLHALAGAWAAGLVRQVPLGAAAGLLAAAANPAHGPGLGADLDPARRRQLERAERRGRLRARELAARAADVRDLATSALAVSISGDLPEAWRHGRYLAIPPRVAGLPRLVIGRPGQGKSVYLGREVYLAALAGRRCTVVDCKGEPGFAEEITAAYLAGRPDASVHVWPEVALNGWTGGPAAVANRLLACWEFDLASQWYREVVALALRLALHAPGPPVASSAELVARMQPGARGRLWNGHRDEQELVRALGGKLDDVAVRVGNLMASLGSTLDGPDPIGTADCTVLSLPVMAAEHDAAAILRVALADLAHHVAARKAPGDRELVVVDEFSAVAGGREHAIHLAERGRSAGVATVLAVQSRRGLGDDDDADRLIGAAGMVALFGTAEPEDVLKLAGTVRQVELAAQLDGGALTGRGVATVRAGYRVDGNDVRALAPGQAYLLAGGRAELCQVIRAPACCEPGSRPALPPSPRWGRPALLPRWRRQ